MNVCRVGFMWTVLWQLLKPGAVRGLACVAEHTVNPELDSTRPSIHTYYIHAYINIYIKCDSNENNTWIPPPVEHTL